MKASELRDQSVEEIAKTVVSLREEQFKLRMNSSTGQLNTHHKLTNVRKDIARAKTILKEKQGNA